MLAVTQLVGFGSQASFAFAITLTSNVANFNLNTELTNLGWDGQIPAKGSVTVNPGVIVSSTSSSTPAFDMGAVLPARSQFTLNVNGSILGKGGDGGFGGARSLFDNFPATAGGNGSSGGNALKLRSPATVVVFATGSIRSGGGGGPGGGGAKAEDNNFNVKVTNPHAGSGGSGGGGGGGSSVGLGGSGGGPDTPPTLTGGGSGSNGSASSGGAAGARAALAVNGSKQARGGRGGAGGAPGNNGGAALANATASGGGLQNSAAVNGSPGVTGNAIDGVSLAVLINNGTITGPQVN